ncbi:hypothetical protein GCM10007977_025610 [Dactylosporangium sucinum]|uniref:Uncharacterized protein n=1 Tax=Dactylosporangium sucinum TaxID=1424081 RepID=A0A917WRK8_9ACTN|nr:hypothetical protein GCM10007977_025610 [Dactylosporangium sucinum]
MTDYTRPNQELWARKYNWPAGALEACNAIEDQHPDWHPLWEPDSDSGSRQQCGFYAGRSRAAHRHVDDRRLAAPNPRTGRGHDRSLTPSDYYTPRAAAVPRGEPGRRPPPILVRRSVGVFLQLDRGTAEHPAARPVWAYSRAEIAPTPSGGKSSH